MKNYIKYIGVLIIGLALGWLLFGNSSDDESINKQPEVTESNVMWTCSMHPQVMQPEFGDCPLCGMDLIPADAGADGLASDQFKMTENALALANVQTSIVGEDMADNNPVQLSGKITENEETNVVQASYFSGRIEQLNVNFIGESVSKGQLLATIYSPDLYAAQQELITATSLKESQPSLYKAVRNKLKLWKLTDTQINQIEESGKVQENFPVYATVSGTVSKKLVEQGSYIKQGQPLLKIANLNTVWGVFDVYENQIDLFKKGQEVLIKTKAYVNKDIKGKVDFIDPVMDSNTRTLKLRVVLNNRDHLFKPGMFVSGELKNMTFNENQTISIPASAVMWTGERSLVYLKTNPDRPVFEMREVVLGNQLGDNYEVLEGLNDGDEIVTNGTFTIDAAAQLQGKKSMMNKAGETTVTGHEGHAGAHTDTEISNENQEKTFERVTVSVDFQNQLNTVYNDYINLKDALVKDDAENAVVETKKFLTNLSEVDMKLLTDEEAHNTWMTLEKELMTLAKSISQTSEIDEQRNYFKPLSSNIISAVQLIGVNEKIYLQYCPMADNDTGGFWLSKEEQILNPYFGDMMLKCGLVEAIIE